MSKLSQAMILTAGMSTRMQPLTNDIPKILLPAIGKNLFERMLDFVAIQGITSVAMNVFHGKEPLLKTIADTVHTVKVTPYQEASIRGTGGGISGMQSFIRDDHFAVINCDSLTETVLADMFEFHVRENALATLLLVPMPMLGKYGSVKIDSRRKIVSFNPPSPQKQIFAGVHILSKEIFKHFPNEHNFCIVENVYKPLIEKGAPILGFVRADTPWFDLGELKLYHDSLFGLLRKPLSWMTDIKLGHSWIYPGIGIPETFSYLNVILEKGVTFEGAGKLQDVIVFPNTKVGDGSYEHVIITPVTEIKIRQS